MNRADAAPSISTELVLIRHAPAATGGRLTGRRDVALAGPDRDTFDRARTAIGRMGSLVSSPARRCIETARLLFPDLEPRPDGRLWEQDFGEWEGLSYAELPDLGMLGADDLANHRPPGGESFADVCERVHPALRAAAGDAAQRVCIVAHAGPIRAALALALGMGPAAALAFEIAPLSMTAVRLIGEGTFSVSYVNRLA